MHGPETKSSCDEFKVDACIRALTAAIGVGVIQIHDQMIQIPDLGRVRLLTIFV